MINVDASMLENLYSKYNHREYVDPDPLFFMYRYPDPRDREIAGILASGLAYGRVSQIMKSVSAALEPMGSCPRDYILHGSNEKFFQEYSGFKHRFSTDKELCDLMSALACIIRDFGSIEYCVLSGMNGCDDIIKGLTFFTGCCFSYIGSRKNSLLPDPVRGSACKRLMLYCRWMIRNDEVDPGGWNSFKPDQLIVPLDTHMHRFALAAGFTSRCSADLQTAREITGNFKRYCAHDPVKYDFALTRFGIRPDMKWDDFCSAL